MDVLMTGPFCHGGMMRKWSLLCALLLAGAPLVADDAPPLPGIDLNAAPAEAGMPAPPADAEMAAPPAADAAAIAPPEDSPVLAPPAAAAASDTVPAPPADSAVAAPPVYEAPVPAVETGVPAPPADAAVGVPPADSAVPAPVQTAMGQVTVLKGQNLWAIAGTAGVYGDSWLWPLLYVYNKDRIQDPDIIKPDWQLQVKTDVAADVKDQQVAKAKETPRYVPHTTPRSHLSIEY